MSPDRHPVQILLSSLVLPVNHFIPCGNNAQMPAFSGPIVKLANWEFLPKRGG